MEKTLAAVFDDRGDAQRALDALIDDGFSSANARITSAESDERVTRQASPDGEESLGEKIANFFGFGDDDETYSEAVRRGNCVLVVDAADDREVGRAEDIINQFGPSNIDEKAAEWRESGWRPALAGSAENATGGTIPIVEEQLQVGKREVQKGGVRIVSRTTEKPVEATVSLRDEQAKITRRPVDRAVTDSDTAFKETSFEVRETAEEAVVGKTARVVEEVTVSKESGTHQQAVKDSVRKTEVEVEQLGAQRASPRGTLSRRTTYAGPERRKQSSTSYSGIERRAA